MSSRKEWICLKQKYRFDIWEQFKPTYVTSYCWIWKLERFLSVTLKRADRIRSHTKLSSSWSTPQPSAARMFFWQYGPQPSRTRRILVLDNNPHPSPSCPAIAPSLPVCCSTNNPAGNAGNASGGGEKGRFTETRRLLRRWQLKNLCVRK